MKTTHHSRFRVVLLLSLALFASLFAQSSLSQSKPETIQLKNNALAISLDKSNGRIVELVDLKTRTNFVGELPPSAALWQIDFLPGSDPALLPSTSAKRFRWESLGKDRRTLRLIWEDFGLAAAPQFQVEVRVELAATSPESRWGISLRNIGTLGIEKVRFPRVVNIPQQPDERLAASIWMGGLTKEPRRVLFNRGGRLEWPYPGTLSLQCLALYRENGPGLYLSCDDTAAFRKAFAFWGDEEKRLGYEMIHHPENQSTPRTSYSPTYRAVIGTFVGDWITAAERYREWGTKRNWARNSRLNRGLVPEWLLKTGLWVWNRGPSEGVLKPAMALQKELDLPISVFWHWWHGCAYDTGFPEYLPPREGTEHFKQALGEAHRQGLKAIVYMNQRLWGMTTESWKEKGAERYAVKTLQGTVRPEVYNTFTGQACATMCIATPFWRNTYASIAEEAVRDLGVDGIYMDQACSSLLCYDPTHGHPLGGGTFWINGFRLLSSDIRTRTKPTRNVLLAGEGAGEAWLPYLDLMLTLEVSRERYATPGDGWEIIPFFQSVYHAYGITYGSYSSLTVPPYDELWPAEFAPKEPLKLLDRKYASQFYLEQARAFAWGIQPTIANFRPSQLQDRPDEIAYLMKLARIRHNGEKYLLYGTFLRPPRLDVPITDFESSRLSIYAGQKARKDTAQKKLPSDDGIDDSGGRQVITTGRIVTPGVLAGAWRAKSGDVGIAIASILDQSTSLQLDLKAYGYDPGDEIFRIDERGRKRFDTPVRKGAITLQLEPRGACIIELVKEAGERI